MPGDFWLWQKASGGRARQHWTGIHRSLEGILGCEGTCPALPPGGCDGTTVKLGLCVVSSQDT